MYVVQVGLFDADAPRVPHRELSRDAAADAESRQECADDMGPLVREEERSAYVNI